MFYATAQRRLFLVIVIHHAIFWPFGVFILAAFGSPHEK
jgi:hypothetical protein